MDLILNNSKIGLTLFEIRDIEKIIKELVSEGIIPYPEEDLQPAYSLACSQDKFIYYFYHAAGHYNGTVINFAVFIIMAEKLGARFHRHKKSKFLIYTKAKNAKKLCLSAMSKKGSTDEELLEYYNSLMARNILHHLERNNLLNNDLISSLNDSSYYYFKYGHFHLFSTGAILKQSYMGKQDAA